MEEDNRELRRLRERLAVKDERLARLERRLEDSYPRDTGLADPAKIVWVFGAGRTGSTWLAAMMGDLAGHEVWFEPQAGQLLDPERWGVPPGKIGTGEFVLSSRLEKAWLPAIRDLLLRVIAARFPDDPEAIVIKEPHGSAGAPALLRALPESRVVLLVRDPRDTVASALDRFLEGPWREGWRGMYDAPAQTPDEFVKGAAKAYQLHVGRAAEAFEIHRGPKSLVRYEDLLADTLGTMRRLYSEIGLPAKEEDLVRMVRRHSYENVPPDQKGPGKRVRSARVGSWRKDLTSSQVRIVENYTASSLAEFYPPSIESLMPERGDIVFAFWDSVIEPLLEVVNPRDVVEVGAEGGAATERLLEFCERHGATLRSVDPAPAFDVAAVEEEHGGRFVFDKELSLVAIPGIPRFDAVLLDGDHNWYTVYNELQAISDHPSLESEPFPLVFLHDLDWPYGRRDLYYAPETIPEEYRKPHGGGGLRPGEPGLLPYGGLNPGAANASEEGGPRNGVLTAVEDFLEESDRDLELVRLRGLYGFGLLFPRDLRERAPGFADLLRTLETSPAISRHIEALEESRVSSEIQRHEADLRAREMRQRLADARDRMRQQNAKLRETNQHVQERRDALKTKNEALTQRNKTLRRRTKELERELEGTRKSLTDRVSAGLRSLLGKNPKG